MRQAAVPGLFASPGLVRLDETFSGFWVALQALLQLFERQLEAVCVLHSSNVTRDALTLTCQDIADNGRHTIHFGDTGDCEL